MSVGHGQRRGIRETEISVGRMRIPRGSWYRWRMRDSITHIRWEGALLQLVEFDAVEEVLIVL